VNDFRVFLESLGLVPGSIVADGRWRRCPTLSHPRKKNGAFKLAPDAQIGWGQDHAVQQSPATWRPDCETAAAHFDPDALRRANAEARRKLVQATHEARAFYAACAPLVGGHPYLSSHGLDMTGCYGLKVDGKGWLVVPAMKDRNLMSVQRISPDGEKRFWPGASVKGASYVVERPRASLSVVCEGLATALAIYAAAPLCRVLVAFNAGNLAHVPVPYSGLLTMAADNDHQTVCKPHKDAELVAPFTPWNERPDWCLCNPGRHYGEKFAAQHGCGVAMPERIKGTDWCDLRYERIATLTETKPRELRTAADVRRAVDAVIADAMMRAARFHAPDSLAGIPAQG
jgi:putative DNA primase/helicase